MEDDVLSVGIVGSGMMGSCHAAAIGRIPDAQIGTVLGRSGAERLADQVTKQSGAGQVQIVDTVAALADQVDVALVAVPNDVLVDTVRELCRSSVQGARLRAVMVEKPLGRNLREADEICRLVKDSKLHSAYLENQLYMTEVREQRQSASLAPFLVRTYEEHAGPHQPWFWDASRAGGGVLLDMGCHSIAAAWELLTPAQELWNYLQPVAVTCTTAQLKWARPEGRRELLQKMGAGADTKLGEDYATGVVEFRYPATGQIVLAQFCNSWMYDAGGLRLKFEGLGAGYGFTIDAPPHPQDPESAYGYVEEDRAALVAFREHRDAPYSLDYGRAITRLVMACYLSAQRGARVDLLDPLTEAALQSFSPY